MLDVLSRVEEDLPQLLRNKAPWTSVFINYHPPIVERLWLPYEAGQYRIYLHRIHPCEQGEALFHPHPWPSAIYMLEGSYEMGIGYGAGDTPPPEAAKLILKKGSRYEMLDPDGWHYVRPLDEPSLSLMVTGKPWDRKAPGSDKPLPMLSVEQRQKLFKDFEFYYR